MIRLSDVMAEYAKEKAEKVKKYTIDAVNSTGRLFLIVGPNGYEKKWLKSHFIEQVEKGLIAQNEDGTFSYTGVQEDVVWVR